jgi:hypothetical protein
VKGLVTCRRCARWTGRRWFAWRPNAVHHVVRADELDAGDARKVWHGFADLVQDTTDSAAGLDSAGRAALARRADAAIRDLQAAGARVLACGAARVLYVAVLPKGLRRDVRLLFARPERPPAARVPKRRGSRAHGSNPIMPEAWQARVPACRRIVGTRPPADRHHREFFIRFLPGAERPSA